MRCLCLEGGVGVGSRRHITGFMACPQATESRTSVSQCYLRHKLCVRKQRSVGSVNRRVCTSWVCCLQGDIPNGGGSRVGGYRYSICDCSSGTCISCLQRMFSMFYWPWYSFYEEIPEPVSGRQVIWNHCGPDLYVASIPQFCPNLSCIIRGRYIFGVYISISGNLWVKGESFF